MYHRTSVQPHRGQRYPLPTPQPVPRPTRPLGEATLLACIGEECIDEGDIRHVAHFVRQLASTFPYLENESVVCWAATQGECGPTWKVRCVLYSGPDGAVETWWLP